MHEKLFEFFTIEYPHYREKDKDTSKSKILCHCYILSPDDPKKCPDKHESRDKSMFCSKEIDIDERSEKQGNGGEKYREIVDIVGNEQDVKIRNRCNQDPS